MDGWMDGRKVGWVVGWIDEWMDGWMYVCEPRYHLNGSRDFIHIRHVRVHPS
jgi:hypothetical protein